MADGNASTSGGGGIGVLGLLGVIFVTLKILEIDPVSGWSWAWVLSPFWIGLALFVPLAILILSIGRR